MNKELYRLEVTVPEEDYDRLSGLLTLEVAFGWEEESLPSGETRFRIHCEQEDFLRALLAGGTDDRERKSGGVGVDVSELDRERVEIWRGRAGGEGEQRKHRGGRNPGGSGR